MFRSALHRRVALAVALAALALSGAVAGASVTTSVDASALESVDVSASEPADVSASETEYLSDSPDDPENATAELHHDGEHLVVPPGEGVEITGETTVEPGTELIVVVESQDGSFVEPERTTVRPNGTFAATFDLTDLDFGTELAVVVRTNETVLERDTDARVMDQSAVDVELEPSESAAGSPLVLRGAPNQTVHVRSDAPAGTEVVVTLRSTRYNVLKSSEVTVGDDGTGTATFNLSRVEPGASFTVSATGSDDGVEGVVVSESATVHRDATFPVSDPASDYAIHGEVLGFATELDVDLAVEGTTRSETVAVGEDGTFAASYDLSSVSAGAEATVEVGGIPRSVSTVVATEESDDPTAYVLIESRSATIRYPEETMLVHPTADQTVRGTTNLRPGTELTVKVENAKLNSPNAFDRTTNVTVREDGTFVAPLNFTGVEPGTNFSVRVGPGLARMDGQVVNESVTLPTVTTTEPMTQPTTDESAFTTGTTTTPDDGDDGHVDEFVPGFGVPAALVALLAALLLARRNRT